MSIALNANQALRFSLPAVSVTTFAVTGWFRFTSLATANRPFLSIGNNLFDWTLYARSVSTDVVFTVGLRFGETFAYVPSQHTFPHDSKWNCFGMNWSFPSMQLIINSTLVNQSINIQGLVPAFVGINSPGNTSLLGPGNPGIEVAEIASRSAPFAAGAFNSLAAKLSAKQLPFDNYWRALSATDKYRVGSQITYIDPDTNNSISPVTVDGVTHPSVSYSGCSGLKSIRANIPIGIPVSNPGTDEYRQRRPRILEEGYQ